MNIRDSKSYLDVGIICHKQDSVCSRSRRSAPFLVEDRKDNPQNNPQRGHKRAASGFERGSQKHISEERLSYKLAEPEKVVLELGKMFI